MQKQAPKDLSTAEWELVQQSGWLLTKNQVIEKVYQLLGKVHQSLETAEGLPDFLFPAPLQKGGKISKGENYGGLPYLILDFPRHFSRESIFALRTMFWWGHDFTCTLHLAGRAYDACAPKLMENFQILEKEHLWVSTGEDPWVHHLTAEHFRPLADLSAGEWKTFLQKRDFVKLSRSFPLSTWDNLPEEAKRFLQLLLRLLR